MGPCVGVGVRVTRRVTPLLKFVGAPRDLPRAGPVLCSPPSNVVQVGLWSGAGGGELTAATVIMCSGGVARVGFVSFLRRSVLLCFLIRGAVGGWVARWVRGVGLLLGLCL